MQTAAVIVCSLAGSHAEVELLPTGCGRCKEPGGCGGQGLSRAFCSTPRRFTIDNALGAGIGDHVRVAIGPDNIRRAATNAYLIPLLALLVGAFLGGLLDPIAGVAGGVVALGLAWHRLLRKDWDRLAAPRMIERIVDGQASGA